jgi:hypothetical protein
LEIRHWVVLNQPESSLRAKATARAGHMGRAKTGQYSGQGQGRARVGPGQGQDTGAPQGHSRAIAGP